VRYRKYFTDGTHREETEVIGYKVGPEAIKVRAANQRRKDFMAGINRRNRRPPSQMTLAQFYEDRFQEQVVARKTGPGQKHYRWCWARISEVPAIPDTPLCEFTDEHLETIIAHYRAGLGAQSLLHLKNCISAIFKHAKKKRLYRDENPASLVDLPTPHSTRRPSYSLEQCRRIVARLRSPLAEMVCLSVETSMGPSELKGLRRSRCNLTGQARDVDGVALSAHSVLVCEGHYEGKSTGLKRPARRRICPITPEMAAALAELWRHAPDQSPDAPVFQAKTGRPVDTHNATNRDFKRVSAELGFNVAWYGFRRAHSTVAGQVPGLAIEDRQRTMGHADAQMTLYYSVEDIERRRALPQAIRAGLIGDTEGSVQ
jgi:integrase